MNEDFVKGKLKGIKGEAKVWWGKTTGDLLVELDGNKDKIEGWFQENQGLTKELAEKELSSFLNAKEAFENKTGEVAGKFMAQFDKLTKEDLKEVGSSFEKLEKLIINKYQKTELEISKEIKKIMSEFH